MAVYEINVYDNNWKCISKDYFYCNDRQQANLRAEKDCDWLGGAHYEAIKIR